MLFALSTGHEIGLAATGSAFIAFALLSSFVFPRMNPDFPGKKGMRWYIPLAICFFIAMISAVLIFGRSKPTAAAAPATSSTATPPPASSGMLTSGPYAHGSASAGKGEFTSFGCSACHTFTAAGAKGTIGPNLDEIATYAAHAQVPLEQFIAEAITHPPPPYVPTGFPSTLMPPDGGRALSNANIADLVAFIASG